MTAGQSDSAAERSAHVTRQADHDDRPLAPWAAEAIRSGCAQLSAVVTLQYLAALPLCQIARDPDLPRRLARSALEAMRS